MRAKCGAAACQSLDEPMLSMRPSVLQLLARGNDLIDTIASRLAAAAAPDLIGAALPVDTVKSRLESLRLRAKPQASHTPFVTIQRLSENQ